MSKFLTQAAVTEFDNEVLHEYQGSGKLRNTVTVRTNVTGEAYKFTRMGQGIANQKASQANVTPMDVSHGRQTVIMENWNAPEYTDIFDQAEVNFDEKSELAMTIGKALSRREDQIIIDAINAGSYLVGPGNDPDTGALINATAEMTVAELRRASTTLTKRSVATGDRCIALTADTLDQLLATTQTTSSDYNTVKALVNGEIDTFLGFKFEVIDTREEGGLPGDGTATCSSFAYHKSAVGYANGIDMRTEIDWVPEKTSWLANGLMKAGAIIRQNSGIVKILSDATIVPAQA